MPPVFAEARTCVKGSTMLGDARLEALFLAVQYADGAGVKGCIVECGCWKGGAAAVMAMASAPPRDVWVFDSFQGLPAPTAGDDDQDMAKKAEGKCRATVDDVTGLFKRLAIPNVLHTVAGWFKDTLPFPAVPAIAVLHVDADFYDGTKRALEAFYDKVEPGGTIQIDDYGHWAGARRAVDEFMKARGIAGPLVEVDYTARQIRKPKG